MSDNSPEPPRPRRWMGPALAVSLALNLLVLGAVAVDALEVVAAHVHVHVLVGVVQALVQVAMLHGVAAAATEVAAAAIFTRGQADAFRRRQQVDALGRHGVTYSRAYSSHPVCVPARAAHPRQARGEDRRARVIVDHVPRAVAGGRFSCAVGVN